MDGLVVLFGVVITLLIAVLTQLLLRAHIILAAAGVTGVRLLRTRFIVRLQ